MNAIPSRSPPGPGGPQRYIEQLCDHFEARWKEGGPPRIEDFLAQCEEGQRSLLLRELVLLEIAYRIAVGDDPRSEEYLTRFPTLEANWLALAISREREQPSKMGPETATLSAGTLPIPPPPTPLATPAPAPAAAAPRQIRCPHCHNPIQLGDQRSDEVLCPGCGSHFRVRDAQQTISAVSLALGKFALLERIGLGAFGAVWRARDTELERIVALKIPHAGLAMTPEERRRVYEEARRLAQLRHPGIVTVHEVATLRELPVIVSDFIRGVPLNDLVAARKLTFRETASLVAEVAEALDYAHRQGVVHRDIKPANLIVEYGPSAQKGALAGGLGKPLILDFGLALQEKAQATMTQDGQIIGTPAYMSPEQAAGRGHRADRRSDVYSLGVVLYELLCGELPFRGSWEMMLYQVQMEEPRVPRYINHKIPLDLETICLKCLQKEPGRRYATAAALAEDLQHFLRGEPIHARPIGRLERLGRWCRRHPAPAALTAAVFLLLALLAGGAATAAFRIERERQKAEKHFDKTLQMVDLLTHVALEGLENTPQMQKSELKLLKEAQDRLSELLEDAPAAPLVREKLALVNKGMGAIWAKHGEYERAEDAYSRAIATFRRLARTSQGDEAFYQNHLAVCLNELGEIFRTTARPEDRTRSYYDEALKIQTQLPAKPEYQQERARTRTNLGILLDETKKAAAAADAYRLAIQEYQHLGTAEPAYRAGLARTLINQGKLQERNEPQQADGSYRQAIALLTALTKDYPVKHDYRYKLAATYNNLANVLINNRGQFSNAEEKAEEFLRQATELFTRLESDFPDYHLYRKELANVRNTMARVLWETGRREQAEKTFDEARGLFQNLVDKHPELCEYHSLLGVALGSLGYIAFDRRDLVKARKLQELAVHHQNIAWEAKPAKAVYRSRLKDHYKLLIQILEQLDEDVVEAKKKVAQLAGK